MLFFLKMDGVPLALIGRIQHVNAPAIGFIHEATKSKELCLYVEKTLSSDREWHCPAL